MLQRAASPANPASLFFFYHTRALSPPSHHHTLFSRAATPCQVRLNVLAKLEALGGVISLKTLAGSLLPALTELGRDRSWRVRLAAIDLQGTSFARLLGADCFQPGSEAVELALEWLMDQTFAIREAGALNCGRLAEAHGGAWAERALLPRVIAMAECVGKRPPAGPLLAWQNIPIASTQRMTALMVLGVR